MAVVLVVLLSIFAPMVLAGDPPPSQTEHPWQQELDDIDREVKRLKDLQNRYKASAERHDNTADRLQFDSQFTLDAKYERKMAERARLKMVEIQDEIDELEVARALILKQHPEYKAP